MYYEDLHGRLSGQLILSEDRMEKHEPALIHEFIAAGERPGAGKLASFLALAGDTHHRPRTRRHAGPRSEVQMEDNVPAHWRSARGR